jgi:hypothetical protein
MSGARLFQAASARGRSNCKQPVCAAVQIAFGQCARSFKLHSASVRGHSNRKQPGCATIQTAMNQRATSGVVLRGTNYSADRWKRRA